jgi:hypothetical protein
MKQEYWPLDCEVQYYEAEPESLNTHKPNSSLNSHTKQQSAIDL